MSLPKLDYDIAVIGGGLTGKMMALALSHSGYKLVLVAPENSDKPQADERSTTIHHAGYLMLGALGLHDHLADNLYPITAIKVAMGDARPYHSDWLLNWHSKPDPMAYVVINQALNNALDKRLAERGDAITFCNDTISAFHETPHAAVLERSSGEPITTKIIIACDGTKSPMRALAGMTPKIEETGQQAIITTVEGDIQHDDTAYQRFLATGPLALMPLDGKALSLVWSTSITEANKLLDADEPAFNAALTKAFGDELGTLSVTTARHSFPLRPHFNKQLSKGRLILAGDAAHAIHPLAGMGYNLALADIAVLLELLQKQKAKGLSADHPSLMASYQRRRMPETAAMTSLTSQLNRLLSRQKSPLSQVMAVGMSILDKTPLKTQLRKVAMGGVLSSARLFTGRIR